MLSPDTSVPANDLETPMNDVLTLLLSISEDPTVDFTYRLSALKAMARFVGPTTSEGDEQLEAIETRVTATVPDRSDWRSPVGCRFSPN